MSLSRSLFAYALGHKFPVALTYNPGRPYEVEIRFCIPNRFQETWTVGREFFALGLDRNMDNPEYGIKIRPIFGPNNMIEIYFCELSHIAVNRDDLYSFLDDTWKVVEHGREHTFVDQYSVEQELQRMIA